LIEDVRRARSFALLSQKPIQGGLKTNSRWTENQFKVDWKGDAAIVLAVLFVRSIALFIDPIICHRTNVAELLLA
jgi:hypothetical protein